MTRRLRLGLQLDLILLDNSFKTRNVLNEAIAGETEKVIAELRILEVDFEQPILGDGQHLAVLDAFDRLRPSVVGREKAQFAHNAPGRKFDADFFDQKFSGNRKVHLVRRLSFAKQHIAAAIVTPVHKRLQPIH